MFESTKARNLTTAAYKANEEAHIEDFDQDGANYDEIVLTLDNGKVISAGADYDFDELHENDRYMVEGVEWMISNDEEEFERGEGECDYEKVASFEDVVELLKRLVSEAL